MKNLIFALSFLFAQSLYSRDLMESVIPTTGTGPVVLSTPGNPLDTGHSVMDGNGEAYDYELDIAGSATGEGDTTFTVTGTVAVTPWDANTQVCQNGGPVYVKNCLPNGYCTLLIMALPKGCSIDSNSSMSFGLGGGGNGASGSVGVGTSVTSSEDVPFQQTLYDAMMRKGLIKPIWVQIKPGKKLYMHEVTKLDSAGATKEGVKNVRALLQKQLEMYAQYLELFYQLKEEYPDIFDPDKQHLKEYQDRQVEIIQEYLQQKLDEQKELGPDYNAGYPG